MKTLLLSALIVASSFAQAAPLPANGLAKMIVGGAAINQQSLAEALAAGAGPYGRVLVGMSNATNGMGSTIFTLPMTIAGQKRVEMRASLRVNHQGRTLSYGVSSNPEAYHMDVGFVGSANNTSGLAMRLEYRPALTHQTPAKTRILVYDAAVNTPSRVGRLVATVQQSQIAATPGLWKTNATYLRFLPK